MNPHFYKSLVNGTKRILLAVLLSPILRDSTSGQSFQAFLKYPKMESERIDLGN